MSIPAVRRFALMQVLSATAVLLCLALGVNGFTITANQQHGPNYSTDSERDKGQPIVTKDRANQQARYGIQFTVTKENENGEKTAVNFQARADDVDIGRASSAMAIAGAVANPVGAMKSGLQAVASNPVEKLEKIKEGIEAGREFAGKVKDAGGKAMEVGGQAIETGRQASNKAMDLKQKLGEKLAEHLTEERKQHIKNKIDEHLTEERKQKLKEMAKTTFEYTKKGIKKGAELAGVAYQKHQQGTLGEDVKQGTFDWLKGGCCCGGDRQKN